MIYYHGQISYSLIDNIINNRACYPHPDTKDYSYIVEESGINRNIEFKDDEQYVRYETRINEWYTIDFYSKVSREHCLELLQGEEVGIKQMFEMKRRKEQRMNLIGE